MFCCIHLPLADTREFLTEPTGRHPLPDWESAHGFLRSTGQVQVRQRGGLDEWPGEERFCDIAPAVRFPDHLDYLPIAGELSNVRVRCAFRRLYSYGAVSQAVVGFRIGGRFLQRDPLTADDLALLVRGLLDLRVRIPNPSQGHDERLLRGIGKSLAAYVLSVTTRPDARDRVKSHWLEAGDPQVHLELEQGEVAELPRFSRVLEESTGHEGHGTQWSINPGSGPIGVWGAQWKIGYWRSDSGGGPVGTWFLRRDQDDDARNWLRNLRILMSRLHCERETLRLVLRQLTSGKLSLVPHTAPGSALEDFLTGSIQLLERASRYGSSQSTMLDVAGRCTELVSPGATATLKAQLTKARRNTLRVVGKYVERESIRRRASIVYMGDVNMTTITFSGNVQVTGDFNVVVAERIENSFNKAAASAVDAQIKEAIKELGVQVAELAKQLPPAQADAASRDYESLTNEALAQQPRRHLFDSISGGLLETASNVATMAGPIAGAVKKLMQLLRFV